MSQHVQVHSLTAQKKQKINANRVIRTARTIHNNNVNSIFYCFFSVFICLSIKTYVQTIIFVCFFFTQLIKYRINIIVFISYFYFIILNFIPFRLWYAQRAEITRMDGKTKKTTKLNYFAGLLKMRKRSFCAQQYNSSFNSNFSECCAVSLLPYSMLDVYHACYTSAFTLSTFIFFSFI